MPHHYIHEHTATLHDCDTCHVLSVFNEPYSDYDPTIGLDLDPNLCTDTLIPSIDAILDNVCVRDFTHQDHQVKKVKLEPELEDSEIFEAENTRESSFDALERLMYWKTESRVRNWTLLAMEKLKKVKV
jgi:hypothetical protein